MTGRTVDFEAGGDTDANDPGDGVGGTDDELTLFLEDGQLVVGKEVAHKTRSLHAKGLEAIGRPSHTDGKREG